MTDIDPLVAPLVWLALGMEIGASRRGPALWAYAGAFALVVAAFVAGFALLWIVATASYPSGSYNSPADLLPHLARYEFRARVGLWVLYGRLLLGGVVGYVHGRRATGHGGASFAPTAAATLLLLVLTFPPVNFLNACVANVAVVFRGASC